MLMKNYIVTGATGYIGSMLIKYIQEKDKEANITALVRDRSKAENMLPHGVEIAEFDLCDKQCAKRLSEAGFRADYIIHCASVTASAQMLSHPVEVIESIVNTTQNILEFARRYPVKSVSGRYSIPRASPPCSVTKPKRRVTTRCASNT